MNRFLGWLLPLTALLLPLHGALTVFLPEPLRYWKEVVLLVLAGVWLWQEITSRRQGKVKSWQMIEWLALAFLVWMGILTLIHPDPRTAIVAVRYLGEGFFAFFLLSRLLHWVPNRTALFHRMLAGFLIGVLISVLYGIWAKFGGGFEVLEQFYATTISSWVPGQIVTLYHETSGIARMQGTASGPNAFGTFCMMGVFLLPFLRTKKLFKIVILAFLVFAIQQSYSRGVMLGTCVGALSLLALRYRVAWWKVLFVGATLVALVGSLFLWNEDFREDMLRRGGTSEHLTRPVAAIEIGWQSPWVGNLGQLGPAARMKNLRENNDDKALIAENVLVDYFAQTGILGLGIVVAFLLGFLFRLDREWYPLIASLAVIGSVMTIFDMVPVALTVFFFLAFVQGFSIIPQRISSK